MTKSEVKAIIHSECNLYASLNLPQGEIDTIRALYVMLCQAIDEAEDEAEWIREQVSPKGYHYYCTKCKNVSVKPFKYCPSCGKKMKAR